MKTPYRIREDATVGGESNKTKEETDILLKRIVSYSPMLSNSLVTVHNRP